MKTMKKILTILILLLPYFIVLTLLSCEKASDSGFGDQVTISKDEYEKLKGDTLNSEYPKPFKLHTEGLSSYENSDGIVLGSDKHEYLVWNYGYSSCNVEHYIDCKLCKERPLKSAADKEYERLSNIVKQKEQMIMDQKKHKLIFLSK
jgi:hypothetical protein